MRFEKGTIKASPYLGVFAIVTEKIALIPQTVPSGEYKTIRDLFGIEPIKCSLGESSLIGVLSSGISNKILLSELVTHSEEKHLQSLGLETKIIRGVTAIGNLMRITEKGGIVSRSFTPEILKEMEAFLEIPLHYATIAKSDLVGSSCAASLKGFVAHPNISNSEFQLLKKVFQVDGKPTTSNYGDRFVGNCILCNSKAVMYGINTTGHELLRIDEGLSGE